MGSYVLVRLLNGCWMEAPLGDCECMGGLMVGGVIKLNECLLLHFFISC